MKQARFQLLKMSHQVHAVSLLPNDQTAPSLPMLEPKKETTIVSECRHSCTIEQQGSTSPTINDKDEKRVLGSLADRVVDVRKAKEEEEEEMSGPRERWKKHRVEVEVAGRVWIPDIWGQEDFLKDWVDCTAFDDSLFPNGIVSARNALVEEGRRGASARFRIENRC